LLKKIRIEKTSCKTVNSASATNVVISI